MIASFQWDLNYSNPEVFLAMVEEMLFIANLGVDVLRLDALAFVWKEKGTVCESLPKTHTLIQAFQYVASIATGEPFQLNPTTGDCRICGTMASLADLEQAEKRNDEELRRMAVSRMKMMYAVQMALPGLPLLYAGDEKALLNDYSYRDDKSKKDDSRWVHRIKIDWSKKSEYKSQEMVADFVKKVIVLRKEEPMLGGSEIFFYDIQDSHVFAFRRGTIHVVANFSDSPAEFMIDAWSENSRDLLSGRTFWNHQKHLLSPYEVRWLKEIIE